MAWDVSAYFNRRIEDELRRAAESTNPLVKQTHERFAATYREELDRIVFLTERRAREDAR